MFRGIICEKMIDLFIHFSVPIILDQVLGVEHRETNEHGSLP